MDVTVASNDESALSTQDRLYYLKSVGRKHGKNALRLLICIAERVKLFAQEPENQMKWSDMEKEEYGKALFDTINRTELGILVRRLRDCSVNFSL
jgi:hypothetical protein